MTQVMAYVEPDVYAKLRKRLKREGVTFSAFIRDVLDEYANSTPSSLGYGESFWGSTEPERYGQNGW